ncbi:MAG TPA: tetratricopeptide repeat protein, partial [Thermoanaerobaculia bacterium]
MTHYDEESLFEFVEGTSRIAADIESHAASCRDCADEIGERRALIGDLASRDTWQDAPEAPRQFVRNLSSFVECARREDEEAVAICDEILSGPASWWAQRLRQHQNALTAGVAKQLLERWRHLVQSSPANALQVTALAGQVANALDVARYPSDYVVKLRAQAYRDHAYVLLYMGRHPEALEYVERARRLFEQVPLPEYDLARVATVKAAILRLVDRIDEAVALARDAAETFRRFGDETRFVNARMTEAAIHYERGAVEQALEVWMSIDGDPALDDLGAVGVKNNIANCYADLGQPERAAEYVQPCIAQFEMLGMETERTRSRWLLGRTLVASGRHHEAIPILRATWRE